MAPFLATGAGNMRGEGDDRRVATGQGQCFVGADFTRGGITVHLRHAAIHEDEVGLALPPEFHRLDAIDGDIDANVALAQNFDDDLAIDGVVVGNDDAAALEADGRLPAVGAAFEDSLATQCPGLDADDHVGDVGVAKRQDYLVAGAAIGNGAITFRIADPAEADDFRAGAGREGQRLQPRCAGEDDIGLWHNLADHAHLEPGTGEMGSQRRLGGEALGGYDGGKSCRGVLHRRLCHFDRQADPEGRAAPQLALHSNCAAHGLDQAFADGKAQPGAAKLAGDALVGLREGLEQDVQLFLRNADAAVTDRHDQMACLILQGNEHLTPLGEFQGIVDEVGEDLVEADRIGQNRPRHARCKSGGKVEPLRGGFLPEQAGDIVGDAGGVHRNSLQLQFSGLDLRQVENVVDDGEQAAAGLDDDFGITLQALIETGARKKFGHDHQAVQRRTDFVAHGGEKARLGLVGAFRGIARQAQFVGAQLHRGFEVLAVSLQSLVAAADFADHGVEAVDEKAGFAISLVDDGALIAFGGANILDCRGERQDGTRDVRLQAAGHGETNADGAQGDNQAGEQGVEQLPLEIGHIGDQHHLANAFARLDDIDRHRIGTTAHGLEDADAGLEVVCLKKHGTAQGCNGPAIPAGHGGIGDFGKAADGAQNPERLLGVLAFDMIGQCGGEDIAGRFKGVLAIGEVAGHVVVDENRRHQADRKNHGESHQHGKSIADAATAHRHGAQCVAFERIHTDRVNREWLRIVSNVHYYDVLTAVG